MVFSFRYPYNQTAMQALLPYPSNVGSYAPIYGTWPGRKQQQALGFRNFGSLTTTKRKKKRLVGSSFKAKLYKTLPAKHYTTADSFAMTHNTLYTCIPSEGIVQGTGNTQRDGDKIHIEAIKLKGTMQAATASNAYSYRILVGFSGEELSTASIESKFVSGLGVTELFLPTTATFWNPNGIVNPKAFTLLYDTTIDINSQIASSADLSSFATTVPINMDFPYQATGSVFGKFKNLCVVVTGSVAGGTSGVTSVGAGVISMDLIFKSP